MRLPPLPVGERRKAAGLSSLLEGMHFVWATPVVMAVLAVDFLVTKLLIATIY